MQCSNNQKQLGIALHNYHDTFGAFPARSSGTGAPGTGGEVSRLSGTFFLLPFMEQQALYDNLRGIFVWNDPFKIRVGAMLCPSDSEIAPDGKDPNGQNAAGVTNYVLCSGDSPVGICETTNRPNPAVPRTSRGMFAYMTWYGFRDCTDGSSNTLAFSELARGIEKRSLGMVSNTTATNPAACTASISTSASNKYSADSWSSGANRGFRIFDGSEIFAGFNTITPPNGASCFTGTKDHYEPGMFAASSRHPGGVLGCFTDGSVSFITETINTGDQSTTAPARDDGGQSPYGVWGALGTRSGGESKQLP
ncbi:hypothetical protein DSM3645_10677 [Blastopirellula marina DSM 3645]|uniref:DUF1559 domain-containing protein n=2 Tax=Blastopirellula marina TaxID=124 RepID=A3ZSN1_9BACT|nr:hypothetical protein DSM3645_10677 [Blastopirellula marina DSM 3645]